MLLSWRNNAECYKSTIVMFFCFFSLNFKSFERKRFKSSSRREKQLRKRKTIVITLITFFNLKFKIIFESSRQKKKKESLFFIGRLHFLCLVQLHNLIIIYRYFIVLNLKSFFFLRTLTPEHSIDSSLKTGNNQIKIANVQG